MTLKYTNRKMSEYTLYQGITKTGKPMYFFAAKTPKSEAKPISRLPKGYEIYENINGLVFCRKIKPKLITDAELKIVTSKIKKYPRLKYYKAEREGKEIIIYEAGNNEGLEDLTKLLMTPKSKIEEFIEIHLQYLPIFRFVLVDKEKRLFDAYRWVFIGDIDGWSYALCIEKSLAMLVSKYIHHLGKESFYDLV